MSDFLSALAFLSAFASLSALASFSVFASTSALASLSAFLAWTAFCLCAAAFDRVECCDDLTLLRLWEDEFLAVWLLLGVGPKCECELRLARPPWCPKLIPP